MERTKKWAAAIGVGGVVVAGTGAAVASQSAPPNNVIRACVKNANGATRIIRPGQACSNTEHLVTWNKNGPAGPPGLVSVRQTSGVRVNIQPGDSVPVSPSCGPAEKVIGGGFNSDIPNAVVVATESRLQDANTWGFTFYNATGALRVVTAYAICAG